MSLTLEKIREIDIDGMIDHVLGFPDMCEDAFSPIFEEISDFEKIGVVGMGGSGIGGDMLKSYLRHKSDYPVIINKNYDLPKSIDQKTLLFVISYSGNTEETLSSLREGINRGCKIGAISSNGELKRITENENISLLKVPEGIQPRAAFPFLFLPMVATLNELDVVDVEGLEEALHWLRELKEELSPMVGFEENLAKKIASRLQDSIPVIYSHGILSPVAYRWKCQLNENSKMFSITNEFPELNHNEVVGWGQRLTESFEVVVLKDSDSDARIDKKIRVTEEEIGTEFEVVELGGDYLLTKLLSGVFIGDLVSVYLGILNGVNPTPVSRIDSIKDKLSE